MSNTLKELKTTLQQELVKEPLNFERISELSNRLLALDPQATRFTVDAQHIHRFLVPNVSLGMPVCQAPLGEIRQARA